jgi:alkylation response protein AidB-like acyl-CoA dehydrogenase
MQGLFSDADLAFRDEVRAFLDAELTPDMRQAAAHATGVFIEPEFGLPWAAALNRKGWLATHWPVANGGTGWSPIQHYIFEKECAVAGAPSLAVMGLKLLGPVVCAYGTEAQKQRFLPAILSGEHYWCQGFSEPNSGSDLASLKTTAVRDGDVYRINGTKIWTTHAQHANWIFCLLRTEKSDRPQKGISFILVDMNQPGITIRPILTLSGYHEVNQIFFDNAEAPVTHLVGEEGQGWEIAKFLLENERGGSCHAPRLLADLNRIEQRAHDITFREADALANKTSWRTQLAKLRLRAEALEVTELKILNDISKGRPAGPQTSVIKLVTSSLRQEIDEFEMQMYGPAGLQMTSADALPGQNMASPFLAEAARAAPARYLNSRAWTIFGGTNEVQANIVAKTVLKL